MKTVSLDRANHLNYRSRDYFVRGLWLIVWATFWKLLWYKFFWLRPLVLKLFGADVPMKCQFFSSTWIERPNDIKIGIYTSIGPRVHLYNLAHIEIGDHTILSQDVYVCGGTHDFNDATMPLIKKNVKIGSSVWICAGAFIAPGVTIGDGSVVGARAVVTRDVEPWTVVAGNPAKFIRKREIRDR